MIHFHWAHLQQTDWVDEHDRNDGQAENQYSDGKEPKRSVASSEAADVAINVPALYRVQGREKSHMEKETTELGTETSKSTLCNKRE